MRDYGSEDALKRMRQGALLVLSLTRDACDLYPPVRLDHLHGLRNIENWVEYIIFIQTLLSCFSSVFIDGEWIDAISGGSIE